MENEYLRNDMHTGIRKMYHNGEVFRLACRKFLFFTVQPFYTVWHNNIFELNFLEMDHVTPFFFEGNPFLTVIKIIV